MIKLSVGLILINVDDFGNGGFEDEFIGHKGGFR
jgi:hypothetical protein